MDYVSATVSWRKNETLDCSSQKQIIRPASYNVEGIFYIDKHLCLTGAGAGTGSMKVDCDAINSSTKYQVARVFLFLQEKKKSFLH